MSPGARLSAEERRHSILKAAIPLFAKFGFNGTTTKQIARAADVSEALLYRHFPSKEVMYQELQDLCCESKLASAKIIEAFKPSTSTLVHAIYFLIYAIYQGVRHQRDGDVKHTDMHRLMANSYLEDGAFARVILEQNITVWEPLLSKSAEAAVASGDIIGDWIHPKAGMWFSHHLGVALGFLNLPPEPVFDYGFPRDQLLDFAVRFCLRGLGLTDTAIATHYNPAALALFASRIGEN